MSAPRRVLAASLLRAVATATKPSPLSIASPARTRLAPRAPARPSVSTSIRWYSAEDSSPPSRTYSFRDIVDQLRVNDELDKSGKEETEDGERRTIFVDVREPDELLETGRIPGAINIPVTRAMEGFQASEDDFVDMYGFERPAKDAPLVFYCKAGIRAKTAMTMAQMAGYTNVGDYPGSWLDWESGAGEREVQEKQGSAWTRLKGGQKI